MHIVPVYKKVVQNQKIKPGLAFYLVKYKTDCPICLNYQDCPVILSHCEHVFCTECIILNEELNLLKCNNKNMKIDELLPIFEQITQKFTESYDQSYDQMIQNSINKMEHARLNVKMCCPVCSVRYYDIHEVKFIFSALDTTDNLIGRRLLFRRLENHLDTSTAFENFNSFPYNSMYHLNGGPAYDNDPSGSIKLKSFSQHSKNQFMVFKTVQVIDDVFYQQIDGEQIYLSHKCLDKLTMRLEKNLKKKLLKKSNQILPKFLSMKIKSVINIKNSGRIRHLDWDSEIKLVDGEFES